MKFTKSEWSRVRRANVARDKGGNGMRRVALSLLPRVLGLPLLQRATSKAACPGTSTPQLPVDGIPPRGGAASVRSGSSRDPSRATLGFYKR